MANAIVNNYRGFATNDSFSALWKLTRTMLAAGWRYKSSADGSAAAKDTTGGMQNDGQTDKWAVGGIVNVGGGAAIVQSGTTPTFAAPSNNTQVVTFSGSTFSTTLSPGRYVRFANAANAGNNGSFRIISAASATSITIANPGGAAETGLSNVTYQELRGGNTVTTAASGTGGADTARQIITGLTGMVMPTTYDRGSEGNRLTIKGANTAANNGTFLITRVLSSTDVEIDNSAGTSDANNGTIEWVEVSPTEQVYQQACVLSGGWICLQGPSTLKVFIGTNVATGTFRRGENVTQTTSGAEGEIIGYLPDPTGGLGYLVIRPRENGTAGGRRGWSTGADTVTGATSGATITTVATAPIEWVREHVFWKGTNQTSGHWYCQVVDAVAESASRFSVLAAGGGITSTIAPGGNTSGFPTPGSWVPQGTGASNSAGTGARSWTHRSTQNDWGIHQFMCANAIEQNGVSADGTFLMVLGIPNGRADTNSGMGFFTVDNHEDGDVDPYFSWCPYTGGAYPVTGSSRTVSASGDNSSSSNFTIFNDITQWFQSTVAYSPCYGWRRRGFSTGDAYQQYEYWCVVSQNGGAMDANYSSIGRVTNTPKVEAVFQPLWVISTQVNQRQRKGTVRHLVAVEGGSGMQTYNGGRVIQLGQAPGQFGTLAASVACTLWNNTIPVNG